MNIKERFLEHTDDTGRFIYKSLVTGKEYYVEPILVGHTPVWGDINPATKQIEGNYGEKYAGCISKKESLITPENGFKVIEMLEVGESPLSVIEARDKEYELKAKANKDE